ncbi:MAG: DUF2069 domain-containing protein [Rubrivivax sp.]
MNEPVSVAGATVPATPHPVVQTTRAVALAGLLALIALGLAWELWLAPTGRGTLALKVLPLVFCVAGLWRHRMYTFRWLSLLLWLYVLEGLSRAPGEGGVGAVLAVLQVVLALVVFSASAVYIRWRLRHAPPADAGAPQVAQP